jgi:hypothetical protein
MVERRRITCVFVDKLMHAACLSTSWWSKGGASVYSHVKAFFNDHYHHLYHDHYHDHICMQRKLACCLTVMILWHFWYFFHSALLRFFSCKDVHSGPQAWRDQILARDMRAGLISLHRRVSDVIYLGFAPRICVLWSGASQHTGLECIVIWSLWKGSFCWNFSWSYRIFHEIQIALPTQLDRWPECIFHCRENLHMVVPNPY